MNMYINTNKLLTNAVEPYIAGWGEDIKAAAQSDPTRKRGGEFIHACADAGSAGRALAQEFGTQLGHQRRTRRQ